MVFFNFVGATAFRQLALSTTNPTSSPTRNRVFSPKPGFSKSPVTWHIPQPKKNPNPITHQKPGFFPKTRFLTSPGSKKKNRAPDGAPKERGEKGKRVKGKEESSPTTGTKLQTRQQDYTKAEVVVAMARIDPEANGAATIPGEEAPRTSTQQPERTIPTR